MALAYSAPNTADVGQFACALHHIRISPLNPRKAFDEARLAELAESIAHHGLLEPIVVRETANCLPPEPGPFVFYEIVAGERRYRAMWLVALARSMGEPVAEVVKLSEEAREAYREQAGLEEVPVRSLGVIDDAKHIELALVENLQRQDLDPIEEAEGYRQLNRVVGLKQAAIAAAVKRSQPAIANAMRLLDLPEDVQALIRAGELSVSHGVALARFKDFPKVASQIAAWAVEKGWTAKEVARDLPGSWQLVQAGLAREIGRYDQRFDSAVCESCPFGAKVGHYCLKPAHWDELQKAGKAERQAKVSRAVQEARADGGKLPDIRKLQYDEYDRLYGEGGRCDHDTPESPCPCRIQGRFDDELVWICSDPARRRKLTDLRTREANKAKKLDGKAALANVLARIDGVIDLPPEILALMAAAAMSTIQRPSAMQEASERHAPGTLPERAGKGYWDATFLDSLAGLAASDPAALARVVLETVLRNEIANRYEGYGTGSQWTDWYMARTVSPMEAAADD